MSSVETLTIEGTWNSEAGDPERVIRTMFTTLASQKVSTVFIESRRPDSLDVISMPDPYDIYKSRDEYKLALKVSRECLKAAGYTIVDDTEAERAGRQPGTSDYRPRKKESLFKRLFSK